MKRQAILLMMMMVAITIVVLTSCGGEANVPKEGESTTAGGGPYSVDATMASLQEAGWEAEDLGEPEPDSTYAAPEIGYLEATAPDGEPIDLQYFASPEEAQAELEETKVQEAPFDGTTIGNVLVFNPENETAAVSEENLQALQGLLR